ncbi:hypothetical protein [Bradyrhizobium amphicarpaeae]|uniref:hypothetical protein n=1 Tax=Bradyrhizobium amphicarpaeae TaxID=1404768 RepID=UPI0011E4D251|nr:hypothetical protein [Bradyrhizobium amphicarpaeae]
MQASPIWKALVPLFARMAGPVREHEVLRVAATIGTRKQKPANAARQEVLAWAQRRSGGRLPQEAWQHRDFEYFSGGRNSIGVRIQTEQADVWAIRAEDPDKQIPGRIWTTEVVVGTLADQAPRFSLRLLASTSEDELDIEPHVPGLVQQVAEHCGLARGCNVLAATPRVIRSYEEADDLCDQMVDQNRKLPLFVLTVPEAGTNEEEPLLDADSLARATLGIAIVVVVPAPFTWGITDRFGKQRSVFGGAVRVYLPGFAEDASPYNHRLVIADHLATQDGPAQCARWIRTLAAYESVRRTLLGDEVLAFAAIRSSRLKQRQQELANEGASDVEQLKAAELRIATLEKQVEEERAAQEYYASEHDRAEQRAEAAEEQQRASAFRVQQLLSQIEQQGEKADATLSLPDSWADFANWCDSNLAGRVVLSPVARRAVKSPEFTDFSLAANCLLWLANEGRNSRISGGDGSIREEPVSDGVRNAHCGKDSFDFSWQGNQYTADWHIKNGGNTRDPSRCLRIYYAWDGSTQQMIVADMPYHRRTGAT